MTRCSCVCYGRQRKSISMIFTTTIAFIFLSFPLIQTFEDYLENISINTGEPATLICDLPERFSNRQAEFYGPNGRLLVTPFGEAIGTDDRTRFLLEHTYAWTWSLIVSDVSDEDAGEYTCRVSTDDRTLTIIKRFNLTVLTPPKIVDITIESNSNGILIENEQVILKCLVRGIPFPKIFWSVLGKKSVLNDQHQDRNIITYDDKLLIRNFSRVAPMNYQCIADNGIPPRDTRTRYITPAIPPELSIQSSVSRMTMQIQLICIITARPLTYAKWKHEGIELNEIRRLEINDFIIQLILLISIDPSDVTNIFGLYECIAENQLKLSKAFIMIDNSFLSNLTSTLPSKQQRLSSSSSSSSSPPRSYANIELLLNGSSILISYSNPTISFGILFCIVLSRRH